LVQFLESNLGWILWNKGDLIDKSANKSEHFMKWPDGQGCKTFLE